MQRKPSLAARREQTIQDKLRHLRAQLEQFQEFKQILREDGIAPDEDDKRKESRLIQQILGYEKDLKRLHKSQEFSQRPSQKDATSKSAKQH